MTEPFQIAEATLVKQWGVTRSLLREMRSENPPAGRVFIRGVDWTGDAKGVFWTPAAADEVAASIGIQPAPQNQTPALLVETLTVVSKPLRPVMTHAGPVLCHFGNPHLIQALRQNGERVYVRVPDASKFTTHLITGEPMRLKARLDSGQWLLDQRAPRWRGRW